MADALSDTKHKMEFYWESHAASFLLAAVATVHLRNSRGGH